MVNEYFDSLEKEIKKVYKIAETARSKGLDPSPTPEIPLAKDLAERVEGIVGPKGISKEIKKLEEKGISRENIAFTIAKKIVSKGNNKEKMAEQALRTSMAVLTEGVVAAPIEGIAKVKIKDNYDGTKYLSVYYAGPIRSAGGTASALSVLIADYIRKELGLDVYKPIEEEIERYVEEVELYESEVTNFQYSPSPDEVRLVASNIPVEITGEPTDKIEVSYRNLERVETNHLRGGALLVLVEGLIQKASKVVKYAEKLNLDNWKWLKKFLKVEEDEEEVNVKPNDKYLKDVIGGRPVLAYPSKKGGFRLRYGRARNTGLAAMGLHPATMEILEFTAVGTQMKIERPGKGNCVVPVDSVEGPIVKLKNGDVIKVKSREEARKIKNEIDEILFLGDILVAPGEFINNNHPFMPSAWCEEWWKKLLNKDIEPKNAKEAFEISKKYNVPLHPKYTYFYHDVSVKELNRLYNWLRSSKYISGKGLRLKISDEKKILEKLGVPHHIKDSKVIIKDDHAYALLNTLRKPLDESLDDPLKALNKISPVKIMPKAPTYIGGRIGRPEKSKERRMRPAPHVLFPIGKSGGNRRNIVEAAKKVNITVEISRRRCKKCKINSFRSVCPYCKSKTELLNPKKRKINIKSMLERAYKNTNTRGLDEIKGVEGMISSKKLPEALEKGILRAKNGVSTFKDGTIRHDSTNLPLTHFTPKEIGVDIEKLKELGYKKDCYGRDLVSDDQILELKVQDIIISEDCASYLMKVANFVDDLLEKYYGLPRFYNVKKKEDLVGHLVAALAPHTSAAIVGRIIGFTKASACYAHPYFHAAKRRNCFPGDSKILVQIDGKISKMRIDELYEKFYNEKNENKAYVRDRTDHNIKAYSFDKNKKKVVLSDIKEVLKVPTTDHLIKIILEDNRSFETTIDHPVIVYEDGKFKEKRAFEVQKGDSIFIPRVRLNEKNYDDPKLDSMVKIIGYYLREGENCGDKVTLPSSAEKYVKKVFGNNYDKNNGKLILDSSQPFLKDLRNNKLPDFVFNLSKEKIHEMIKIATDDDLRIRGKKELLEEIDLLLISKLGIFGKYEYNGNEAILKISNTEEKDGKILKVKKIEIIKPKEDYVYSLNVDNYHTILINENILTHQCDGDEDSVMLLLDALLNFSKYYLPEKRGGSMDAPLVLSTRIDPEEIDDEAHNIDTMQELPLEFYNETMKYADPSKVEKLIDNVKKHLGTSKQYKQLWFSHNTSKIDGAPKTCLYKKLGKMEEKVDSQLSLAKKIRAVDHKDTAERVLVSHFLPDIAGNVRAFLRQKVRCTTCNKKYRRIPLSGKCECGGNLVLTVSKGSVIKYLDVATKLKEEYPLDPYVKQRIKLLESTIKSLFENEKLKQTSLMDFI